jgi:hypothetical protein
MPGAKKLHSRLRDTIIGDTKSLLSSSHAVTIFTGLNF